MRAPWSHGPSSRCRLAIGKREEAGDAAVGVAGAVVPARDGVDRNVRIDAGAVAIGAEGGRRDGRIGGQRVVLEAELADELGHAEVALMLGHGRASETAFRIVIDGLRPIEVGVLEIRKLAQEIAPVLIERNHQLVVGLGEAVEQQPARIVVVGIGVPHRKQRRDGLHRRVAGARQEVRRRADIGDARRADRPVGPRLPRRSNRRSRGSRRARPASGSCRACRSWRRCRARRRRRRHSRAARRDRATCRRWGSAPSSPGRRAAA